MLDENLTPEERGELLKLLRETIERDRYPLSPRIRSLKAILAKLDPSTVSAARGAATCSTALGEQHHRAAEAPGAALTLHGQPKGRKHGGV